jgi:hypothetical protein
LSHNFSPDDIFLAVDSSFGVFEEMVKADCHKDCAPISLNNDASPINNNFPFLSLSNMIIPRKKAEALLPILLVLPLRLNSSSSVVHQHKSILAPIFAAAYFFNGAKMLPFSIQSGRNKCGNNDSQSNGPSSRKAPNGLFDSMRRGVHSVCGAVGHYALPPLLTRAFA